MSDDLDFIAEGRVVVDLGDRLGRAIERATAASGVEMELMFGIPHGGWSQSMISWAGGSTKIDVNTSERAYLPTMVRELSLPYSDLAEPGRRIRVVELDEILGNKWFMLEDRDEPRDLFGVWWGLTKADVPFERLAAGHKAKYGYRPTSRGARLRAARGHRVAPTGVDPDRMGLERNRSDLTYCPTCLRAIADTKARSSEPKYGGSPAAALSAARPRFEVAGITT